jgi:hypothetical protein
MARLTIRIKQPIEVRNVDAAIEVRLPDDELLGHLYLSRGSLDWRPANKQKVKRVSWRKFGDLMEAEGRDIVL